MTVDEFRELFPEFGDSSVFSDALISAKITMAESYVSSDIWGTAYTLGLSLATAHFVALGKRATLVAAAGGVPGGKIGAQVSKGAGPLSTSYDVSGATEADGGHWNNTIYGTQYLRAARRIGAAPRFVI